MSHEQVTATHHLPDKGSVCFKDLNYVQNTLSNFEANCAVGMSPTFILGILNFGPLCKEFPNLLMGRDTFPMPVSFLLKAHTNARQ